jgi:conjugal transfer pilus assembly protein TraI
MLNFIRKVISIDGESHGSVATLPVIASLQPEIDEEIPRYPPFMKGLPATDPAKLIETQRELIDQIREAGLASPVIFEQFYLESLRRFASYAHLLPASQTHHHRGAGGLLRHAAEVALWSLQSCDRVLLPGEQAPRRRREMEPRWHLAVFLAALCHDLGKPVTDLVVTSRDGAKVWNPFVEDLYSWASRHGADRYFLHWRENRAKKHTVVSALIAERIISQEGLAWISEGDEGNKELVLWMMESINGHPSAENPIHDLVTRSDQVSVERDLRSLGVAFTGYEIGLPVERFLVDIMRRLVRDGSWRINEPGSRLWHIDGYLYLIWPVAGEEIAAIINQEKIPGLPRTPNSIVDMLVDRKLANIREDQVEGNRYWVIAPAVLAEKIPNIRLTAIRLRDTALVIDPAPPSVQGKILDQEEPVKEQPVITVKKLPTETEPPVSPVPSQIPNKSEQAEALKPTQIDQLDGPVGEALKALAEDINSGKKSFESLIYIDSSGVLCLKWPSALNGYGLESKAILDELSRRNWLELDPLSPFRKVVEIATGSGEKWKVVRLQSVVKHLMAIGTPHSEPPTAPMQSTESAKQQQSRQSEIEMAGEDTRLEVIQNIVGTLRDGMIKGILTSELDGNFVWIPSRKAESFLKERLDLNRMKIISLGSVVPDVFMCQTRKKAHCYRIPAMPSTNSVPAR